MLRKNRDGSEAATPGQTAEATPAGSSTIGNGMTVDGNCETTGFLRIEGTVLGNVVAAGVEVTKSGAVEGDIGISASGGRSSVQIGGRVSGTVRASTVQVGQGGQVLGGMEADEATVQGRVEGDLTARKRLAISKTAVIDGEVRAQRLSMEEGGRVNGTIRMGEQAAATSASTRKDGPARASGPKSASGPRPVSDTDEPKAGAGSGGGRVKEEETTAA